MKRVPGAFALHDRKVMAPLKSVVSQLLHGEHINADPNRTET